MVVAYRLTPELRARLQKPIGTLIRGSFVETTKRLKDITEKEKVKAVISVGDIVSKNLVENQFLPQLVIVDNRVMRNSIEPISFTARETIRIRNPAGTITEEALMAIQEALQSNRRIRIIVDGEEDLLTLIAILYAPEDSIIVYGQPEEGVVLVKVTPEKKAEVTGILRSMENARKTK